MTTLYQGGRVFDGLGKMIDGHGVMVENGRIARVAPASEFAGFTGEIVDTAGATLMPGLMDAHVHILYGAEPNPSVKLEDLSAAQKKQQ